MKVDPSGEKEKPDLSGHIEIKDKDHFKVSESINDGEGTREHNLRVKAAMVTELVEMGLSLDAIERILNLKPEVLDRLL